MGTDEEDNPYRSPRTVEHGRKRDGSIRQVVFDVIWTLVLMLSPLGLALGINELVGVLSFVVLILLFVWAKLGKWPRLFGLPAPRMSWLELAVCVLIVVVLLGLVLPQRQGARSFHPPRTPQVVPSEENSDAER